MVSQVSFIANIDKPPGETVWGKHCGRSLDSNQALFRGKQIGLFPWTLLHALCTVSRAIRIFSQLARAEYGDQLVPFSCVCTGHGWNV